MRRHTTRLLPALLLLAGLGLPACAWLSRAQEEAASEKGDLFEDCMTVEIGQEASSEFGGSPESVARPLCEQVVRECKASPEGASCLESRRRYQP